MTIHQFLMLKFLFWHRKLARMIISERKPFFRLVKLDFGDVNSKSGCSRTFQITTKEDAKEELLFFEVLLRIL